MMTLKQRSTRLSTRSTPGSERNAFASHMANRYPRISPIGVANTAATVDTRVQNLSL